MEIQAIEAVIKAFKEAGLTSLNLKCEAFELQLGKESVQQTAVLPKEPVLTQVEGEPQNSVPVEMTQSKPETQKVITSPMVGTFYSAPDPKAQPLVQVGSKVKKGDVVCIIEAMKLMNEVEAEVEGEVAEILVANEEMVEYGQPLFILK